MTDLDAPPAPRPPGARRWLLVIVGVLLAAFATVAGVQWRQMALLDANVRYEGDNIVWSFFQLESEFLKLGNALREIDRDSAVIDREGLQTRYDIFVSRVELVEPQRTAVQLDTQAIQAETVARMRAFVQAADRWLGPGAAPIELDGVRALLAMMAPLGEPVHDMAMWANDSMAAKIGERNALVRRQNAIAIGLTVFQSLLAMGFAAVVVRQLRALEQRGGALERQALRLQEARRDAEAASRTKSAFLANMSHELRTPFQGVLGMIALAEDGPLNAQQAEQLRTARESANHLLALLNDVLDVSALEDGQLKLAPTPSDLSRLVADVQALMVAPARAKGLELRVVCDTQLPAHVMADATRLKQILFNLIGNAIKFTHSGAVDLHVRPFQQDGGALLLCVTVTDSGIGMDEATIARLFKRFSQGDESTSRRYGGTGLGLEISRNLARMMGGDIGVSSQPGVGSRFTLRVPLVACAAPTGAAADQVTEQPPMRVLVAEDHPVNRSFLQTLLERMGHAVTLCENGRLAADAARDGDFDIVLMDMHMPELDGLASTRAIRALPAPRGAVRIVALTADAFAHTRQAAAEAGMDGFLAKPVQPHELRQALAEAVRPGEPARGGGAPRPAPAEPAAAQAPWLDRSTPELIFGGLPPETHGQLLQIFFDDASGTLSRLAHCLAGPMTAATRLAAHSVRGAALSLGLRRIAETTATIEALPDDCGQAAVDQLRPRLAAELLRTRELCVEAGWIAVAAPLRPAATADFAAMAAARATAGKSADALTG